MFNMNWKDYYKLPLKTDVPYYTYAWTTDNEMALTFDYNVCSDELVTEILDTINGDSDIKQHTLTNDGVDFFISGVYTFCIRGWGSLTKKLSTIEAIELQDEFAEYINSRLK